MKLFTRMFREGADSPCTSLVADLELDRLHMDRYRDRSCYRCSPIAKSGEEVLPRVRTGGADGVSGCRCRMMRRMHMEWIRVTDDLTGVYDDSCRAF
jgi:hypothetical protein